MYVCKNVFKAYLALYNYIISYLKSVKTIWGGCKTGYNNTHELLIIYNNANAF